MKHTKTEESIYLIFGVLRLTEHIKRETHRDRERKEGGGSEGKGGNLKDSGNFFKDKGLYPSVYIYILVVHGRFYSQTCDRKQNPSNCNWYLQES